MAGTDLSAVSGESEIGVGAEMGSNLLRLQFVDVQFGRHERSVALLEAIFDLLPGPDLHRRRGRQGGRLSEDRYGGADDGPCWNQKFQPHRNSIPGRIDPASDCFAKWLPE